MRPSRSAVGPRGITLLVVGQRQPEGEEGGVLLRSEARVPLGHDGKHRPASGWPGLPAARSWCARLGPALAEPAANSPSFSREDCVPRSAVPAGADAPRGGPPRREASRSHYLARRGVRARHPPAAVCVDRRPLNRDGGRRGWRASSAAPPPTAPAPPGDAGGSPAGCGTRWTGPRACG